MLASVIRLSAVMPGRLTAASSVIRPLAAAAPQQLAVLRSLIARRSFTVSVATRADATTSPRKPRARKSTTKATTKAAAKKKPKAKKKKKVAKKPKKPKKKAAPKKKVPAYLARGEDGKVLPQVHSTKPKRTTPYLLFVKEKYGEFRNDPELQSTNKEGKSVFSVVKFSQRLGSLWNGLPEAEKEGYKQKAADQNASHASDVEQWVEGLSSEEIKRHNAYVSNRRSKGKKGVARIRDPSKPKGPLSGFFRFLKESRERLSVGVPSSEIGTVSKKAGEEWRSLSESEKEPYKAAYRAEQQEYKRKYDAWKKASNV